MQISIIIPTKNAGDEFDNCLRSIFTQKTKYSFEVIVIDSGSTDNTLDFIAQYPVRLIKIKPEEFGHGKTRNFGARLAKGKYLVYLTQDAIPANEKWLDHLLCDIVSDDELAGAYSRNIPKSNCDPSEARYIVQAWGDKKKIKEITDYKVYKTKKRYEELVFFSNVSSCIQKEIWKRIPFSENLILAEDQDWSKRALEAGYKIVYEPESMVYHSHSYSVKALFKRYFYGGIAHKQVFKDTSNIYSLQPAVPFLMPNLQFKDNSRVYLLLLLIPPYVIIFSMLDLKFMWQTGYKIPAMARWIPKVMVRHLVEAIGFWRGLHSVHPPQETA
jgi:rhamnosyltransferase